MFHRFSYSRVFSDNTAENGNFPVVAAGQHITALNTQPSPSSPSGVEAIPPRNTRTKLHAKYSRFPANHVIEFQPSCTKCKKRVATLCLPFVSLQLPHRLTDEHLILRRYCIALFFARQKKEDSWRKFESLGRNFSIIAMIVIKS